MRVAGSVGHTLAHLGGRRVFGLIGSGNFEVTAALVEGGASFVGSRHETAAVTMADAYARVSGELGVCTLHQGPGLTNAITGLTEAAKSRTPIVVCAADTAAAAVRSNFRIDQDGLVRSVGALVERLSGPQTAVADTVRAVRTAREQRRPVVLMMPLDVQAAEAPATAPTIASAPRAGVMHPDADAVAAAARILGAARRPLIVAGRGAVLAGAKGPLELLGERLGALLATSAAAHGLFAGDRWSLGISGGFASPVAAALIREADAVLAAGATLTMWTTRHGRLIDPEARVIQVDHEPGAIGAHHRVDVGLVGDAAATAHALLTALEVDAAPTGAWRTPEVAARIRDGDWRTAPYDDAGTADRIDPRTLSIALDALLPQERTVAVDSGHFMGYPAMYLRVPDAAGFVFTQGFQSVGLGLASALGAAVARPDRLTVAALGDGGALMSLSELETVARLGPRMVVVVYNDAAYGAEVHHFHPQGGALDLVRFPDTDFAALARAAGIEGVTVRRREELTAVEDWSAAGGRRPLLVDAKVVPAVVAEWLEEAFRGH